MARTKKKIFFLVIGLLVSPFVFKGQCDKVKGEEPEYIIFPKAVFSSNADNMKKFLSNNVLIDDVTDKTRKASQEAPLSLSSDKSTTSLDVEKITGAVSGQGVASETFTDNYATEQAMTSHTNSSAAALPGESTASLDVQDTTRAVSCQGLSPTPAKLSDAVQWYTWNNSNYTFAYQSEMNWDDAMKCCSFLCEGAHLVYIESEQENRKVSRLAFEVGRPANEHWWIGLSDREEEGSWKWGDVPVTYENWRKNEPNNSGAGEDCGELKSRNGDNAFWNDESCNSLRHFICEKDIKADT